MTNREKLLEDLAALSPEDLYTQLADNHLTRLIDDLTCEDCHAAHGDQCPDGDNACVMPADAWLEQTCPRERLIGVGPA